MMAKRTMRMGKTTGGRPKKKKRRISKGTRRFPERAGSDWRGPLVSYREVELLRKFLTSSAKIMSRKRAGTSHQEQAAIRLAVKRARFLALVPYSGI
jgi:small subunit ribosomal protein S18